MRQGPLKGLRVVEFAGIGPPTFCGMLFSDLGADVVRIDRPDARDRATPLITERGRRSVTLNLKHAQDVATALALLEKADMLIEGYRPGVMERLGLGPDPVFARNPRLIYGRITGWGQNGPLAHAAGHDINYIAISGALAAIGPSEKPMAPLNLVGDLGGGALYLAFGMLAALTHARTTGQGQVVDAAMSDGAASLMNMMMGLRVDGSWRLEREANTLDGGAHYYQTYRCADGGWVAVGAFEAEFYTLLLQKLTITDPDFEAQNDRSKWPLLKTKLGQIFSQRTRAEWCALLEGSDACFSPVLNMDEAPFHPHNAARGAFVQQGGVVQPAPAPRFSLTPGAIQSPPPKIGVDKDSVLDDWGVTRLSPDAV